ncbi:MAG TPA: polyhydroxyalkanoate synthesis regulator DNA-binding domain-containing protein [Steroidobacteraceae bacterium]|jgi:polyhydroxyalkanoate synthesis repressor PhaR
MNTREIRKYPNRRLYDTVENCYITLAEIRALVLSNAPLRVTEKQTGRDITSAVLLQVVAEAERTEAPVMTRDCLVELIRQHDSPDAVLLGKYLEQCLQLFAVSHPPKATQDSAIATPLSPAQERTEAA